MRIKAALAVSIALVAQAGLARAEEDPHARFRTTMDAVFGNDNWRVTGGYRTPEREHELRAQGALTVPAGVISRHSMGRPGAPGAYDVVVDGMSPFRAAEKLRLAGAPFRTIFPEAAHGSQGAHLHVDPYSGLLGKAGAYRAPGLPWLVADPTPAQQAVTRLREAALQGDADAQLQLGRIYAEGRIERRDLVEAYVWTALAAANDTADEATRAQARRALDTLTRTMKPEDLLDAGQFVQASAQGGPTFGPVIARPRAAQPLRVAERGPLRIAVASPAAPAACPMQAGEGVQKAACLRHEGGTGTDPL
jgi:hypothetical protein